MAESWRWVDDQYFHTLTEGDRPEPRVVLVCGNIDAVDRDKIAAVPKFHRLLDRFDQLANDRHTTNAEWSLFHRDVVSALAKARGEEVPDA